MKALGSIVAGLLAFMPAVSIVPAEAANGCMEICKAQNRRDVQMCNYPRKEIEELTRCLATARSNFDACKQACGK
ncbi:MULTISPECIES: hypothetical protein [unclassified Bradyrhizobium]|uniref:hypothetical protein n=1 Tax=unclassified Bradyrhizobium TaxID=2631580 RepID=UPI0028EFED4E|nr:MULTISPECIES: hypothetical protein [unclassified Bradyrhizobium]